MDRNDEGGEDCRRIMEARRRRAVGFRLRRFFVGRFRTEHVRAENRNYVSSFRRTVNAVRARRLEWVVFGWFSRRKRYDSPYAADRKTSTSFIRYLFHSVSYGDKFLTFTRRSRFNNGPSTTARAKAPVYASYPSMTRPPFTLLLRAISESVSTERDKRKSQ